MAPETVSTSTRSPAEVKRMAPLVERARRGPPSATSMCPEIVLRFCSASPGMPRVSIDPEMLPISTRRTVRGMSRSKDTEPKREPGPGR